MEKISISFGQAVKFGFGFAIGVFLAWLVPWVILMVIYLGPFSVE